MVDRETVTFREMTVLYDETNVNCQIRSMLILRLQERRIANLYLPWCNEIAFSNSEKRTVKSGAADAVCRLLLTSRHS
jgi:hypothetical protein